MICITIRDASARRTHTIASRTAEPVENVAIFDLRAEPILKPIRHFSRSFVSYTVMRMTAEKNIAELQRHGFCILRDHFSHRLIDDCRQAFLPVLSQYLSVNADKPNRGTHRHFLAMPFDPPCFAPEFFFDGEILTIVRRVMDERVVADQWGCDVPVFGSENQNIHVDYQRPLFPETPDITLPAYMLVVSFGLIQITPALGPIEIAPDTHRMPRSEALRAVECGQIPMLPVTLNIGDVLIRHPWALHRGTPNATQTPRPFVTIRYVRHWYADNSRDVSSIPVSLWQSFTPEQQAIMRFPIGE